MRRVLIVDDALFMRATMKNILTQNGFEVAGEADNGALAVKMFVDLKPDIVLMDITMPEMSGIEALKLIRKCDPEAKVIMVSAMGQEKMVREAVLSGAASFIVKPFKVENVIETIHQILA